MTKPKGIFKRSGLIGAAVFLLWNVVGQMAYMLKNYSEDRAFASHLEEINFLRLIGGSLVIGYFLGLFVGWAYRLMFNNDGKPVRD